MISNQAEYDAAFSNLEKALEPPGNDFLSSPQKYQDIFEKDMVPFLARTFMEREVDEEFQKWSDLVQLIPKLKIIGDSGNADVAKQLGRSIAMAVTSNFEDLVEVFATSQPSSNKLHSMLTDLQEVAFYVDQPNSIRFFTGVLDVMQEHASDFARIPQHGHYAWFSGKSHEGIQTTEIPLEGLVNAAKFLHLHPKGKLSLWTDDVNSVKEAIHAVISNRTYTADSKEEHKLETIRELAKDAGMSLLELKAALTKVEVRPWQDVTKDWKEFPNNKKVILESAINNEINGGAPLRFPASGKDLLIVAAIAKEGGIGFQLNRACKRQLNIFDPFGFQYIATERDQEKKPVPFARFELTPQIMAATKNSRAALRSLERMVEFLESPAQGEDDGVQIRFAKKRGSKEEMMMGRSADNSRYVLSYQLTEEPAHAMEEIYGPRCYERFTPYINQLLHLVRDQAFSGIQPAKFAGLNIDPDLTRGGSDPGNSTDRNLSEIPYDYKQTYDPLGIYAEKAGRVKSGISFRDMIGSLRDFKRAFKKTHKSSSAEAGSSSVDYDFTKQQKDALKVKYPNEEPPQKPIVATNKTKINGGNAIGRNAEGAYLFRIPKAGKMELVLVSRELMMGREYRMDERATFQAGTEMSQSERKKRAQSFGGRGSIGGGSHH